MKKIVLMIVMVVLVLGSVAQDLRTAPRRARIDRSRYERSRYADVADVRLRTAGTLERTIGPEKEKQVRLLIVSGTLNDKDLNYIRKLCNRSRVFGADGKEVSNYLDIDMSEARITGGFFFAQSTRDALSSNMFSYCSHLRSIVLPRRLRLIDRNAFRYCGDLEDVVLPMGLEEIGESAFENCDELINVYIPDGVSVVGDRAFANCRKLRNVYLPLSVHSIGDRAFENTALSDVYLPDRLEKLGACAFAGTNLRSLYLPRNIITIANNNLGRMPKLAEIVVEAGNRSYRTIDGALYDCDVTQFIAMPTAATGEVRVPDGVRHINDNAFATCTGIVHIDLPASIETIGESAFRGTSIEEMMIPEGVTKIGANTFKGCKRLVHVDLPPTVKEIGTSAFQDCETLTSIVIPSGVTTLPKSVFESCKSLSHLVLNEGLTSIGEYTFKKCKALTSVVMPTTLKTLGKRAFTECSLTHVELNEGLTDVGENALSENQLSELTIPSTVTHLGKKVADKNKQLVRIEAKGLIPAELDKESNNKVTLVVPAAAHAAYKSAKNWKNFKNITILE